MKIVRFRYLSCEQQGAVTRGVFAAKAEKYGESLAQGKLPRGAALQAKAFRKRRIIKRAATLMAAECVDTMIVSRPLKRPGVS